MSFWIDSHSHLADPRVLDLAGVLHRAQIQGIKKFLQAGVDPQDWSRQRDLHQIHSNVLPVFGLHPFFVAAHSEDDCESALDQLARILGQAFALGETGLDYRPHIVNGSEERQIKIFEAQLEMASVAQLPVILHVVRAFNEAIQVVDLFLNSRRKVKGLIHAFNGSLPQALAWIDRGFLVSIGGAVCADDNQRLHQAVAGIPEDSIVLETDSPDQPPQGWPHQLNEPSSLIQVAEKVAEIRKMTIADLQIKTSENLLKMLEKLH